MWVLFWIIGAVAVFAAAVTNALLVHRLRDDPAGGRTCLESRIALSLMVATASSFASLSFTSSLFQSSLAAQAIGRPLAWTAFGLGAWVFLVMALAVAAPLGLAPGLTARAPVTVFTGVAFRFFVLPVGKVAATIVRKAAGSATSHLEAGSVRELYALFSRDPSEVLRGEPLAEVVKEFAGTTAEDIMVPRSAMVIVSSSSTLAECVDIFATRRFSRLPVYEGDVESVIGIVHVMDLLKENDLTKTVSQIVRPVPMVPESKRCDELLKEFQKSRSHMAVVLDEYGGIAGLVTVEDVLEELVGELGHEPVLLRRNVHRVADGLFIVHAQVEIEKFESATGVRVPRGQYETLAGYLLQEFGRIPEIGTSLRRSGVLYEVTDADNRKIKLVKVCKETDVSSDTFSPVQHN